MQGLFNRYIAADLGLANRTTSIVMLCDNQAAIQAIRKPSSHSRAKHIDVRYKRVESEDIILEHVRTVDNLADPLTKGLSTPQCATAM